MPCLDDLGYASILSRSHTTQHNTSFNYHSSILFISSSCGSSMASAAHGIAEIASTIQAASINRHPDPHREINPSIVTSRKEPVVIGSSSAISDDEEDEIPISVLRPPLRKRSLPPLPDLRFEQSYLKSIEHANGWGAVAYITIRDQVRELTCDFPIGSHSEQNVLRCGSRLTQSSGPTPSRPRYTMDTCGCWLAALEPSITLLRNECGRKNTKMVVGGQQLEDTGRTTPSVTEPRVV